MKNSIIAAVGVVILSLAAVAPAFAAPSMYNQVWERAEQSGE
jgi:hypothetical protein